MRLEYILKRENNNFDLLRIIAAFLVIYGHSSALVSNGKMQDFLSAIVPYDYSGGLAVKTFFFLSGLVVTNSLLNRKDSREFIISRFFRIFPALFAVLIVIAFLIGPIFSSLNFMDYMHNIKTIGYVPKGLTLHFRRELPDVFSNHSYKHVNGSLWSIPYEVYAYLMLVSSFVFGFFKNRLIVTAIGLLIILDGIMGNKFIFIWIDNGNNDLRFLASSFIIGMLMALWKDKISINLEVFIASWVLCYLFRGAYISYALFYFSMFISVVYLFSLKSVLKCKPTMDISYGVYLWGWPIQQVLVSLFPESGAAFNAVVAIIICTLMGTLSWILIEKPSIQYVKIISKRFKKYEVI